MGLFKSLFRKSKSTEANYGFPPIPKNFNQLTKKAIELIGRGSREMENDALLDHLISNGIPELEAIELFLFLPTAFTRKMLPDLKWLPTYIDHYSESKQAKRKYKENIRFQIMVQETNNYWNNNPDNEFVLNIAGRSSEFHVINNLLNDGGELENIKMTETQILR